MTIGKQKVKLKQSLLENMASLKEQENQWANSLGQKRAQRYIKFNDVSLYHQKQIKIYNRKSYLSFKTIKKI